MAKKKFSPLSNGHKTAIIYCRVSTKSQQDEGTSLETQAEACIKHAESLGYSIGRVTKEVYSGAELWDRPLLSRDRNDIRAGTFQALICYAVDRLSRSIAHLAILDEECRRANCELIFVTEELDCTAEGRLLQSIKSYVAEVEREKIRERTMRGIRSKWLDGQSVFMAHKLFGYRLNQEKSHYDVEAREAAIVRRIFDLLLSGHSTHQIARMLNSEGIPSPRGGKWTAVSVYRMAKHPAYKGVEYGNRTAGTATGALKQRPESEWIRLDDGIRPAIVSPEVWEQVNKQLGNNQGDLTRNAKHPILLRGHVFCDKCGRRLAHTTTREYQYYRCLSWNYAYESCRAPIVRATVLEDWVWSQVTNVLTQPEVVEEAIQRLQGKPPEDQLTEQIEAVESLLMRKESGLRKLIARYRNLNDQTLERIIEREIEMATKELADLRNERAILEAKQAEQQRFHYDLSRLHEYCERVADNIPSLTFEEKRNALLALGVQVYASGKLWKLSIKPLSICTSASKPNTFE